MKITNAQEARKLIDKNNSIETKIDKILNKVQYCSNKYNESTMVLKPYKPWILGQVYDTSDEVLRILDEKGFKVHKKIQTYTTGIWLWKKHHSETTIWISW